MGACQFFDMVEGKNAKEAFDTAVEEARYEYGHGGYTGSIAEKHSFVMIPLPQGKDCHEHAEELIDEEDKRVDDKWGPAGCIECIESDTPGLKRYLFFGWASE